VDTYALTSFGNQPMTLSFAKAQSRAARTAYTFRNEKVGSLGVHLMLVLHLARSPHINTYVNTYIRGAPTTSLSAFINLHSICIYTYINLCQGEVIRIIIPRGLVGCRCCFFTTTNLLLNSRRRIGRIRIFVIGSQTTVFIFEYGRYSEIERPWRSSKSSRVYNTYVRDHTHTHTRRTGSTGLFVQVRFPTTYSCVKARQHHQQEQQYTSPKQ